MRIILVENEEKLAITLHQSLSQKGYEVDVIDDGQKALDRILLNHSDYDLIILPSIDFCSILRKKGINTPILILTNDDKKVSSLLAGADDFLAKPFSFEELYARVAILSRRPSETKSMVLKIQDIELNPSSHVVTKGTTIMALTLKEFVLLEYLMQHPNRVINRDELTRHLWDFNFISLTNVVDVHIKNLRKKLAYYGTTDLIETIRGVGYKLKP